MNNPLRTNPHDRSFWSRLTTRLLVVLPLMGLLSACQAPAPDSQLAHRRRNLEWGAQRFQRHEDLAREHLPRHADHLVKTLSGDSERARHTAREVLEMN